jgi:hypothetical protein
MAVAAVRVFALTTILDMEARDVRRPRRAWRFNEI